MGSIQIKGSQIANSAIVADKISANAIISAKISDGAIVSSKLGTSAVLTAALSDASVTTQKLSDNSISTAKLIDDCVDSSKLASSAVDNSALAALSISAAKLQTGCVTADKILANAVQTSAVNDAAITNQKLSSNAVTAAKMDLTGTFDFSSGTLRVAATPTNANDAASKQYTDSVAQGASWKKAVKCSPDSNVDISDLPSQIDGQSLATDDRFLLKSQSNQAQNGIYLYKGQGNAAVRADDLDVATEFPGAAVYVLAGTNSAKSFVCTNATDPNVGVTNITFTQFAGAGSDSITVSGGLSRVANDISVANLGISTAKIQDDAITTNKILDAQISTSKLQDNCITGAKMADDSIGASELIDASVGAVAIASNAITESKINNGAVSTAKIATANITESLLATNSVSTVKILDNAITNQKMADDSIGAAELIDASVDTVALANLAVTSDKLASASVSAAKISAGAVGTSALADAGVSTAKLIDANVTLQKLAANSVDEGKIAASAIGAGLAGGGGTALSVDFDDATINTNGSAKLQVKNLGIGSAQIADGAVNAGKLGIAFKQQFFTISGSSTSTLDLQQTLGSNEINAVLVFKNGIALKNMTALGDTGNDNDEFNISGNGGSGGVARLTFGAALDNTDQVLVWYWH